MQNLFKKATTRSKHMKIAVYGDSGVGKTYFGLTWPNPAVIDLEGGTDFYSDRFDFSVLDTKSFAEVLEAVKFLETGKHDYQTLVIDPVTVIWSALQDGRLEFKAKDVDRAVAGADKEAHFSYDDWGQIKRFYSLLMTKLTNLPMHVILIGRQKDEYEIKGKEMVKLGVKLDGEKSTPYLTDIRFRLEVKNGKRMAIFEKDRTGHFDVGTVVVNPSYETFRPVVEGKITDKETVKHQDEEEAIRKDGDFFDQQENGKAGVSPNGSKTVDSSSGEKARDLITKLCRLGLNEFVEHYKQYVYEKYSRNGRKIESLKDLSPEELTEQEAILETCRTKYSRLNEFRTLLQTKVPSQRLKEPAQNGGEKVPENRKGNGNSRLKMSKRELETLITQKIQEYPALKEKLPKGANGMTKEQLLTLLEEIERVSKHKEPSPESPNAGPGGVQAASDSVQQAQEEFSLF